MLFTAYVIVRTVPSANRPNRRKKKISASQLGVSIVAVQETGYSRTTAEQSFSDCFQMKTSSTLQKRAGSLWRLARVLRSQGVLTPLRVTEEQLYGALCTLRETGAGATSAQHVLEALFFLDSTAKLILIELRLVVWKFDTLCETALWVKVKRHAIHHCVQTMHRGYVEGYCKKSWKR